MVAREFEVWAPRAGKVGLWLGTGGGRLVAMTPSGDGWWRWAGETGAGRSGVGVTRADDAADIDYGFVLDDGIAEDGTPAILPDPRARRMPGGVHEPSRTFDPAHFGWTDDGWLGWHPAGSVIYELHVGTFTAEGTLDAAAARLDHLASLGVDAVELLPVNSFNGHHNWGYDGVFWFAVHEAYGGPEAYLRFVDACHARGIAVVQDVVYNHLGPSGNVLPRFGPYLSESDANTWGAAVNLDGDGSGEVRRYILDNARMWFADYHVDGLRLDAVHVLRDLSPRHVLAELASETDALSEEIGRPLSLIAESDLNDPVMFRALEEGGHGLTAQWSDDFHHALHVALTGEITGYYADFASLDALEKVLTRGFFHDGTWSSFRGRDHGVPIDSSRTPTWRLVVSDQNHDQIGNRAAGDRLSASLSRGRLAIAATLTLLSPFTPMLFMGEEWGARSPWQFFTSHPEPALGVKTAQSRLDEFERMGWDQDIVPHPQDPATFARSHLDWAEADRDADGLQALYRRLIDLRKSHPALADFSFDSTRVESDDEEKWLSVRRGDLVVVANFADRPRALSYAEREARVLIAAGDAAAADQGVSSPPSPDLDAVPGPGVVVLDASARAQEARRRGDERADEAVADRSGDAGRA